MRLTLFVLVAVCWSTFATATEIYVCTATGATAYGTNNYEVRLDVDTSRDDAYLWAVDRKGRDPEMVGPPDLNVYPTTGSISIVTQYNEELTSNRIQEKLVGFTYMLPGRDLPSFLASVVFTHNNVAPVYIEAWVGVNRPTDIAQFTLRHEFDTVTGNCL